MLEKEKEEGNKNKNKIGKGMSIKFKNTMQLRTAKWKIVISMNMKKWFNTIKWDPRYKE